VGDRNRWHHDELMRASTEIGDVLHEIACDYIEGVKGDKAVAQARTEARSIESTHKLMDVMKLVQADRSIAVATTALDADRWLLNTPAGAVDLRTGMIAPSQPEQLCTKLTAVGPDFGGSAPYFKRFLAEANGGDQPS